MGAIGRSFGLFSQSLAILRKDKELLLFPVLSGVFCILALAGMIWGASTAGLFGAMLNDVIQGGGGQAQAIGWALLFVGYFLCWFFVVFFNVAIVACAKIRFEGGDPVLADGFRAGFANIGRIAAWALLSAIVGILLDMIENIRGVGALLRMILGTAWGILTYFVVPAMIFEQVGPFGAIGSSKDLMKKTWGESLTASAGFGLVFFLLALPSLALPYLLHGVGAVIMLAYWVVLAVVASALSGIYRTGLYVYARTGQVPEGFDEFAIRSSFEPKGGLFST